MHTPSKNAWLGNSPSNRTAEAGSFVLVVMLILSLGAGVAAADEGWHVTVDAGAYAANTYVGSDESFVSPLPAVRATRGVGNTTWFVSLPLEGVGVSHRDPQSGMTSRLSVNFGGLRSPDEYSVVGFTVEHSDRVRSLLAGSPEVTTPLVLEASVEYPVPLGSIGASVGYHPTRVDSARADGTDEFFHGFVLSVQYTSFVPVTRKLAVGSVLGFDVMDGNHAEAWYSVSQQTEHLAAFSAEAGPQDARVTIFASYQVAPNVSVSAVYQNMFLLADAADSPYTFDERQQTFLLRTSYSF